MSVSGSDPLTLVRRCVIGNVPIAHANGEFTLMGRTFPEKTESCFKRSLGQGTFYYSLHDIIFYLNNVDRPQAEYRKMVFEAKLTAIVDKDKIDLKNYLQGVVETCSQLDLEKANAACATRSSVLPSIATSASARARAAARVSESG